MDAKEQLMTEAEVAKRLRRSVATLRRWRRLGRGPKSVRLEGRGALYRPETVEQYLEEQER